MASASACLAQPYANTTNTNPPVFIGPTNLTARVGDSLVFQPLVGGVNRGWVGSGSFSNTLSSWITIQTNRATFGTTNSQLLFRPVSTNVAQTSVAELAWASALPLNQSWQAYVQAVVSTNLAATGGRSALAYLQLFQSNQPAGSGIFSNSSRLGWGRGLTNSSDNTVFSDFLFHNAPYTTSFSASDAAFFTNVPESSRAALVFSNLGTPLAPTNRLVYRANTNGTLFAGAPGPAAALAMPALLLPSASSWQVTATVNLDPSKINEWTDENQGFSIGLNLAKHVTNQTALQLMANRVALEFGWQWDGGGVVREIFAGGTNAVDSGLKLPLFGGGNLDGINTLRLSFAYDASTKTLRSYYEDPVDGWLPADDGLALAGSLGDSWSFDVEKGFFRLILSANSNYALFDDEVSIGAGNAVPGREVPVFFSGLEVAVQPDNTIPAGLAGDSLWLSLKYDATTRELIQGYRDDSSDSTIFLPATVVNLNSWAANIPLQLRLGASSVQTTNPANGIRLKNFSVVPGEGQLVYSLVNNPGDFRIDSDLGTVTAPNLPNAGPISFTVQASNPVSGLTATQTFRLEVGAALPQLAVTSSNLPLRYGSKTASALVVTATNINELGTNPIIFSAPNLPAGLSTTTSSNSLTIGGTPTVVTAGTNLVITASNVAGTATLTSSITIQPAVPRLQFVQNRPNPQYSPGPVSGWSNAYWTLRVSNTAGQNTGAFPNVITVSNLPPGLLFRTEGSLLAGPGGTATNTGIISLATNRITNAGIYSNVVFTASNISGVSTLTSTITVLPTVPVLALVTNAGGATNSGTLSNPVFLNLAFGSSNANWFRITNSLDVPVTYTMQDAPRGLVINPSNGVVSGRIDQAINATNVVFRGTNSAGVSSVLRARISTLPPAPIFSVTNRPSSNGVATDVLTLTVSNFSSMGTNSILWSSGATSATNSQGNLGRFSLATNANRSVFTIRTTTNSTSAGIYSNVTVTASNSGGVTTFTTNLVVLPEIPSLAGISNLVAPPQFGRLSTNALQVSLTRTNRQNLADFPVTFLPLTNLPASWTLNTGPASAWISTELAEEAANTVLRFRASNAAGTNSIDLVLRVLPLVPEIAVTTNSNRLQFGSSNSTNYLTLEIDSFGQNTNQFPVTWRISNAPPGVSLITTNNALVNFVGGANPTRAGVFSNVQVIASNAAGSTTNLFDLTVFPQLPQIRIATNRVQHGLNNANALVIDVTNANPSNSLGLGSAGFGISFLASNLPASLSLTTNSATNAVLGGTPSLSTNATLTLTVSNLAGTISTNVNLKILPAVPVFGVATNRAQFGSNSPAALVVTVANTNAGAQNTNDFPISFSVTPALAGLGFTNTNGHVGIYGGSSPGVVTNARLTVVVSNEGGATTNTNVNLAVLPALPLFSVTNPRTQFGTNSPNALVVTVTNTAGQNTNPGQFPAFTFSSPNLPLGRITFTNTNGLTARAGSADPNLATNAVITVVVSNAAGATTNTNVSLKILPALPQFTLATNRAQIGVNSPGALIATVTNTSGQNTNNFPISFSMTPALPGLGFTNTNGLVGTYGGSSPAVVTNTLLTVVASNEAGATTNSTNFSVLPGLVAFTNLTSLPEARHNTTYSPSRGLVDLRSDPVLQSGSYTLLSSILPPGLNALTNSAGVRIFGTPTNAGIFSNSQVVVSNAGGISTNIFTLRVLPAAPEFSVTNNGAIFGVGTTNALVVTVTNTTRQNTNDFPIGIDVSPAVPGLALSRVNGFRGNYGGTNPAAVTNAALTVTVTNAGGTNQINVTLVVAKGSNTITFGALPTNKVFGDSVFGVSANASSGLAVSFSSANTNVATVSGTNVTIVGAGTAPIVASQAGNSNYVAAANVTNNLVVTQASNVITFGALPTNKVFGDSVFGVSANASSGLAVSFSSANTNVATVSGTNVTIVGAGTAGIVASQAGNSNYEAAVSVTNNLVVTQASNVITFGALPTNKVFGDSVFGVSANASSGLAVSFSSANTNVATVSGTNVTIVGAGTAPIVASQAGNSNYVAAANVTNNLVVGKSTNNAITFGALVGRVFGVDSTDFGLTASVSSGLEISFSSMNESVATVSGTNVTIVGAGTAPIVASQAGNSNYVAAANVTNNLVVEAGAPEIVGTNALVFTNLTTNSLFRYQVSARGAGQFWAGRSDFANDESLPMNWFTNGAVSTNASLGANNGYLRYTWSSTNTNTYAVLEWSQPLPVDSRWLASVTVNFAKTNDDRNFEYFPDLGGLGFENHDQYLGGMLSVIRDATDDSNSVNSLFLGRSNQLFGYSSARVVAEGQDVTNGISDTNSANGLAWVALQSAKVGGTNIILALGNPGTTNPAWTTNYSHPVNHWTNSARTNSLVLRLSGESFAPTNPAYAVEFSEFVIVPIGNLNYLTNSDTPLPDGLTLDEETGLISGTPTTATTNQNTTITISNAYGTTNLTIKFDILGTP